MVLTVVVVGEAAPPAVKTAVMIALLAAIGTLKAMSPQTAGIMDMNENEDVLVWIVGLAMVLLTRLPAIKGAQVVGILVSGQGRNV